MSENGFNEEQGSWQWNLPGSPTLGAILDSVLSSTIDSHSRSGTYEYFLHFVYYMYICWLL